MTVSAPVALVTGGRRGIGRGIAFAMADAGYDVAINDIEYDAATTETRETIAAKGRRAKFILGDIADIESRNAMLDQPWASFGTLDVLVDNAGVQVKVRGDILDVTPESFDRLMNTNLRSTKTGCKMVRKLYLANW